MQEEDLNFLGDNSLHNLHRRERWPASTAVAIQIGKGKTLGLRACGNQSRSQSGQGNGRSAPNSPCAHATICRELAIQIKQLSPNTSGQIDGGKTDAQEHLSYLRS
jgi:hypothetical protein